MESGNSTSDPRPPGQSPHSLVAPSAFPVPRLPGCCHPAQSGGRRARSAQRTARASDTRRRRRREALQALPTNPAGAVQAKNDPPTADLQPEKAPCAARRARRPRSRGHGRREGRQRHRGRWDGSPERRHAATTTQSRCCSRIGGAASSSRWATRQRGDPATRGREGGSMAHLARQERN